MIRFDSTALNEVIPRQTFKIRCFEKFGQKYKSVFTFSTTIVISRLIEKDPKVIEPSNGSLPSSVPVFLLA